MATHRERIDQIEQGLDTRDVEWNAMMDELQKMIKKMARRQSRRGHRSRSSTGESSSDLKRSKKYKETSRSCSRPKVEFEEGIEPWSFDFDDPFDACGISDEAADGKSVIIESWSFDFDDPFDTWGILDESEHQFTRSRVRFSSVCSLLIRHYI
ncbi:hypothetical protein ACS0TY_001513 [Phlomoides rotata]